MLIQFAVMTTEQNGTGILLDVIFDNMIIELSKLIRITLLSFLPNTL